MNTIPEHSVAISCTVAVIPFTNVAYHVEMTAMFKAIMMVVVSR